MFVGDAVKSLLAKREQSILSNLQQAKQRAAETARLCLEAQQKLKQASDQVVEIRLQADQSIEQQNQKSQNQFSADLQKLQESKESTLESQQQKIQKQISQKILISSLHKVDQKFQTGFDRETQKTVNAFVLDLFRNL